MSRSPHSYESHAVPPLEQAVHTRLMQIPVCFDALGDGAEFMDHGIRTLHEQPQPARHLEMWPVPTVPQSSEVEAYAARAEAQRRVQAQNMGVDRARERVELAHTEPDTAAVPAFEGMQVAPRETPPTQVVDLAAYNAAIQEVQAAFGYGPAQETPDVPIA